MGNGGGWGLYYTNFWEYDPATNAWTQKSSFIGGQRGYMSGFAIGNKGYAGMGYNGNIGPSGTYFNDWFEYDPVTNLWTQMANLPGTPRGLAGGFEVGGKGYIGTGQSSGPALQDLWEYNPTTNSWIQKGNFAGIGRQDIDRAVFSIGTLAYWGTGTDGWNSLNDFWEYNPGSDIWTQKANFPSGTRFGATGFSICGMGYLGFGEDMPAYNDYNTFFTYNPTLNTWSTVASCPAIGRCDAPAFVINNRAYLGTGNNFSSGVLNDWWEFTPAGISTLTITSTSTTICSGNSVTLSVSGGNGYSWSNGNTSSSIIISPTSSSGYSVTDPGNSCSVNDSIFITVVNQPTVTITGNTSVCSGTPATLMASGGGSYSWNTGVTSSSIVILPTSSATYSVIAVSGMCSDTASSQVIVAVSPIAQIACSDTVCTGTMATLSASGGTFYSWNTGASTAVISFPVYVSSGYSVIVSDGICADTASCTVNVWPAVVANAGVDTTIAYGTTATLVASGGGSYLWSTGSVNDSIFISLTSPAIFCVTVTDIYNCSDADCITVNVEPIDCSLSRTGELFIPNAFSPNGDNENDFIKIYFGNYDCIESANCSIFNRWGEKVFASGEAPAIWDGKHKGKELDNGVFVYFIEVKFKDKTEKMLKGNISLIR